MPADLSRVDRVLQYALLVAGEQDELSDRKLGPIHLLKYVYLADLLHAKKHKGATYTGIEWKFHKFGPWSQSVNERIEPALNAIGADKQSLPSDYGEKQDWVRWYLRDEHRLKEKEHQLPLAIRSHLRGDILKFGKDTQGLLHHVYSTKPMLSAAPGEHLDFSVAADAPDDKSAPKQLRMDSLSNKKKKKFKERMHELQEKYKNRQQKDRELISPVKSPRYDDVYYEGVAWLDSLAGEQFSESEQVVEFSEEVWKSTTRKGGDVP